MRYIDTYIMQCQWYKIARAFKTFGDLSMYLFKQLMEVKEHCIDVAFDVYREVSVKNTERGRIRNKEVQYSSIKPGHPIRQLNKFLGLSKNKAELNMSIFEE